MTCLYFWPVNMNEIRTRLQLAMTCPRYQESGESLVCMTPASEGKDVSITNTYIVQC